MGHKKRTATSRSKQHQSAAVDEAEPPRSSKSSSNNNGHLPSNGTARIVRSVSPPESDCAAIKLECERALNAIRRGNHTRALRLMKESSTRHADNALIHRVQGTVCVKVASLMDDPSAKQRHLKNAIDSARRAVELSPNSIEFAHFYANLLYEAANDGKEYEEVMRECDRALEILTPVDPANESLHEESHHKVSSAEARIAHVQGELRSLKQKSSFASISTWMKNLGSGEEIRLIPIRRPVEDPMELRLVQSRRPNEIKKATKTPEERRKEIEVRVAAARLLQQKLETTGLGGEGERNEGKGLEALSRGSNKRGERRKYGNDGRKNGSNIERMDGVRAYWKSMSLEMRRELLRISVGDLRSYFGKDDLASDLLNEALAFAEENKTWRFWLCCRCNQKYADSDSHTQHAVQEHMGNLMPKMQEILPQNLDNEWTSMILNCAWKPLDISSAVKMLGNQEKCQNSNLVEDFLENHNEDCDDCFKDACDSSLGKASFRDGSNDSYIGSNDADKVSGIQCKECDANQGLMAYSIDSWPLSEDPERKKLLERIHAAFEVLITHKYLASSHFNKVMQFTIDELQTLAAGSHLLNHGVNQTPLCICFLGASQLRKILRFLQELSQSCGLARYSEKTMLLDDANGGTQSPEIQENIVLDGDASCLYLDDQMLPSDYASSAGNDVATRISTDMSQMNKVEADADALLSWIFAGPSGGEQLQSWMHTKEDKTNRGKEILQTLEKEFYHLQNLCERKCEHLSYEEALQLVEDLCLEEGKRREADTPTERRSYDVVLKQRREQLSENGNDAPSISSRFELDAILNVLKESEALNVNQFGYGDSYGGMTSQFCDLESAEDIDWRSKDYLHQVDTSIEVAIQSQKEQLSMELSKIDAQIMRNVMAMQQLELKLEPVSAYDYRSIMIPLVKSYMRAHLEDLAVRDATEKSDAAREAFLAELALDSKKGFQGRTDSSRTAMEKTKKKNREYKKTKDSKAFEQQLVHDETAERPSSVVSDCEDPHSEILLPVNGGDLQDHEEEEEYRRKIQFEEEERKLEETLEYQRQIENEAKIKHLAQQQLKKLNQTFPEKLTWGLPDVYLETGGDELHELAERLVQENQPTKNLEDHSVTTANFAAGPTKASPISDTLMIGGANNPKMNQGLPKGRATENGLLPFDRRSGRRGRRHKNSNGKYQPVSNEKENVEAVNVAPEVGYNGTKSLRQMKAEDDDEERFQVDLKKAVRQSLNHQKISSISSFSMSQEMPLKVGNDDVSQNGQNGIANKNTNAADVFGTGLKNDVGEYNCFLNVIIQSLWHLRRFRDEFLRRSASEHIHVGDPCVVCAMYEIFYALSLASTDARREAVSPTSLRIALSNLYPDSSFFQEAQMNDASEVLAVIFDCLHQAFTSRAVVSDSESVESNCMGSWDCTNSACLVHSLFGMDIFERMNCFSCGLESRHLKYTSFFHNINASALRTMKVMCAESSFDELLNFVEMNHQLPCDSESGGCGKPNYTHHILSTPPHIFTTVLGWQNTCENTDDIVATLAALSTEVDVSVLYRGLDPKNMHRLVSVVCYYGQHYHCFAYRHDLGQWIMYDDKTVKVIGGWADVLMMCERGHLQPQVLFFEAVN